MCLNLLTLFLFCIVTGRRLCLKRRRLSLIICDCWISLSWYSIGLARNMNWYWHVESFKEDWYVTRNISKIGRKLKEKGEVKANFDERDTLVVESTGEILVLNKVVISVHEHPLLMTTQSLYHEPWLNSQSFFIFFHILLLNFCHCAFHSTSFS